MIKCEIRADDTLHIEGYVNAVERDSDPLVAPNIGKCVEQIRAGAFGAALASGAAVEILENHDRSRKLGSTAEGNLSLREDSIGLRAAADITDKEVIEKARTGQLKGWSFGFTPTDYEIEARADNIPRRIVKALKLSEVSLIDGQYKPCYPGTLVEVRADGMVEFRSDEDVEVVENKVDEAAPDYGYYERCIKLHKLEVSNNENRAEILDIYHSLWYDYLTELRYNHNHDPSNGRFCSGGGSGAVIPLKAFIAGNSKEIYKDMKTGLTSERKGDIIKIGSEAMYRKKSLDKIEPMPKKQFRAIKKAFQKQGGIIQQSFEIDEYLEKKHAEGITYNAKTILLKQNPGRASVFEELIHTAQYRQGKNDGSAKSCLINEIEAQKKLLKHANVYKLTYFEIKQTENALKRYQEDLDTYIKLSGGD